MSVMDNEPEISVIVPAYNAERTIERAVASAIELLANIQSEIIVVDDGSKDKTSMILQRLSDEYPSLRVVTQPNSGRSAARNKGVSLARGRWLIFLDSDDWFLPEPSGEFARNLEEGSSSLIVFPMVAERDCGPLIPDALPSSVPHGGVSMDAAEVIGGMVADDAIEGARLAGYTYEFNSPWSRLYRREQALSLVAKKIPGFGPFPLGLRFSEDRLFNIAYLALERSQRVSFARCAPLYCWDMGQSGTVGVVRAGDGADVPVFAERVASLESSGMISRSEAELLVARETVNRLKRTVLLDSAGFEEAAGIWGEVLATDAVRQSLWSVGCGLHGTGLTGRWRPLVWMLASGRNKAALAYCRALRNVQSVRHGLGRKGENQ